jgi:4-carboxymuconolactone decarboxylase
VAERMPPLDADELDQSQVAAMRSITSGPRGALVGPFTVLLRTPALMERVQQVGAYLRYEKSLPPRLFEMAVLMVARRWDQAFEWAHHHPLALAAGLEPEVALALGEDRRPETDDAQLLAAWRVVDEIHRTGELTDAAYDAALEVLGESGLIELVVTVGYYATLAMVMNVARTPPEPGPALPVRAAAVPQEGTP